VQLIEIHFWKLMYRYPTKPKATKMDPYSSRIRHMVINYLMTETTDENLLRQLTVAQYTYCDSLWSKRWTRSKQKTLNDWLEYMEKCVKMAEVHCIDCDYTIEKNRFDRGDGRIMFTDVVGEYRCGVCDDRCSDPYGMFPDSETDDEYDGNFVEPTEFEEFTYYGTTFWKNVDEASSKRGQWFYEYNNGEVGDELGIYTSDTELEFSWDGKNAGDYVPVLYWCGVIGEKMFLNDNLHPVAKLIKQLRIRPMIATLREENAKLREENAKLREEQQRLREEQQRLLAQTSV